MSRGIKLPEINQYNPELGMPSSGPTTSQPDVAGPIAGVALKLAEVVQNYQNIKTNTAAKLQKETTKNNSLFELKQLEQEYENKISRGEYSGVDTSGKLRDPRQARLDFIKASEKYLAKYVKDNSNTPLGKQTIKESYDLLRYQIGESQNKFDDLANVEIKKNAISTYQINYNDFSRSIDSSTSQDELETLIYIQLNNLENIKYSMDSETYLKEVERIKTDVFIKSVSFQAGTDDPNEILAYILSGKPITQPVDLAEEYFREKNLILDPVFGNINLLSPKDKARLDEITKEYQDNQITQLKKTRNLSPNDPRLIAAIKTLQAQTKVRNEALAENAKITSRNNYQQIRNILDPLRGSTDMSAISAAMQKAYAIANNASDSKQRSELRTAVNTYFNVGQPNEKIDRYFSSLANFGGLTKEFLDEMNEAQRLGLISATDANRYLQLQNKNEAKFKTLDKEALKFGVRYLVQKLDPTKLDRLQEVMKKEGETFDYTMISRINVNQKTLDALQLFHEVMLQGEKDGLSAWQIINARDEKFIHPVTKAQVSALDYTIALSNQNLVFDPAKLPDVVDTDDSGTISISEIEAYGGQGTFVRSFITDVIATEEQRNISERRTIGSDDNGQPIYESIEARNERIQFYKNYRRAKANNTLSDKELMNIAKFFGFDIRKEVETINKTNPVKTNTNSINTNVGTTP